VTGRKTTQKCYGLNEGNLDAQMKTTPRKTMCQLAKSSACELRTDTPMQIATYNNQYQKSFKTMPTKLQAHNNYFLQNGKQGSSIVDGFMSW
jgi:hypothetical protein